jgi:hypothetical protein
MLNHHPADDSQFELLTCGDVDQQDTQSFRQLREMSGHFPIQLKFG